MFSLEHGGCKLRACMASSRALEKEKKLVGVWILIPAPDEATAMKYADGLCGGPDHHGALLEVTEEQLFRQYGSPFAAKAGK